MRTIYEATDVSELLEYLKKEKNISFDTLADRSGIGRGTISSLRHKTHAPSPETLDKLAEFANIRREFLYELAYGIQTKSTYSRTVDEIAAWLEKSDAEVQATAIDAVRAILARQNKSN